MKEKVFVALETSGKPLESGVREKIKGRLPSVPSGTRLKDAYQKLQESEGVPKEEAFKLTGPAALKLTTLEIKLKKDLRAAKDEEIKDDIQEKLDQCEDLARMLNSHIKDIIEQDAKISQENRPPFNYDSALYKKILEAQKKEQATKKLKVHPGLKPLLREINEFIESIETPESLKRAA